METQDTKGKIIKQLYPSEIIAIVGDILAGIILTILILPFESFLLLILIVPPLLSLRGNISGPYIARTSRDLIIGEFNVRTWIQNVFATYVLSLVTSILVGILSVILNFLIFHLLILPYDTQIFIPVLTTLIATTISIPCSTSLNYYVFRYGLNPNNIVNPVMAAVGDFITVLSFYSTLLILGVP
jgi:mgtE-like transporter